jgi:hypothetical protein
MFSGLRFHATAPSDFFSAMYFLMATFVSCAYANFFVRPAFSLIILLVRRDQPAGCLPTQVPPAQVSHPRRS